MAILNLTIDTDADTFVVTLNGQPVANAVDVHGFVFPGDGDGNPIEPHFVIETRDDRGDHRIMTTVVASVDTQLSSTYARCWEQGGFTRAQQAIAEHFTR